MDTFQTSFIPKKPIVNTNVNREPMSIFTLLSIAILVIVALASGGLYFYKDYLTKQKEDLAQSLLKGKDRFEKDTISELELFDRRSRNAKEILNNHKAISYLFSFVGELTLPTIQYTKFSYDIKTDGTLSISIAGTTYDYQNVALQSDVFNSSKNKYFKNVVFSNIAKDKMNNVTFGITFDVDPGLLSYERNISLLKDTPVIDTSDIVLPPSDGTTDTYADVIGNMINTTSPDSKVTNPSIIKTNNIKP